MNAHRTIPLVLLLVAALFPGCAASFLAPMGTAGTDAPGSAVRTGIVVRTRDDAVLRFRDDAWRLTIDGIAGTADVDEGPAGVVAKDTLVRYADVASASGGDRSSTMSQFLLTILGVILVIGLAAIVLYAAFRATER